MTAVAASRAFVVWFRDLDRWNVGSYVATGWRWPKDAIRPLANALTRKVAEVDRKTTRPEAVRLVTLHFDGEMEPRNAATRPVKGRLFWADPGDVTYSKIDVRNGAIGIVPAEMGRVCVTTEYPVYAVNPKVADARYIKLLFRTAVFRKKINGMISGASGRKRVQPDDLEQLEVPLPALNAQAAIIAAWEAAQRELAATRTKIAELEERIEADFLADLGLSKPARVTLPKCFAVRWKDLLRWSVMFNQLSSVTPDISTGKHPVATLGDVAAVSYGIQKCPANRPGQHARPYLRVANVQRGELDLREMKYINVSDKEMPGLRVESGDLLVCEGNSADLVGRPAIWRDEIPDCVHQNHILKVRCDRAKALPDYVLEYMQTPPARNHFRARAKFTTNLASINSNDLREMPLPLPPLARQRELADKLAQRRAEIAALRTAAAERERQAKDEVEAMILGEKAVT